MFKSLFESLPTEKSQIWAFLRNIISGVAGIAVGIGVVTAAQQDVLMVNFNAIIDSAQKIMVELGKISVAIAALIPVVVGLVASFKASFKSQAERVGESSKTEAVVLKDPQLAAE